MIKVPVILDSLMKVDLCDEIRRHIYGSKTCHELKFQSFKLTFITHVLNCYQLPKGQ